MQKMIIFIIASELFFSGCASWTSEDTAATINAASQLISAAQGAWQTYQAIQHAGATTDVATCEGGDCFVTATNTCTDCTPKGSVTACGIVVGLTSVDPKHYNGWSGNCPGTDVDAGTFSTILRDHGIPHFALANERATRANVVDKAAAAASRLSKGGLLILYFSGHGGQIQNSAEPDGEDETICLWDGQLVDDDVWSLLCRLPNDVRVFMVTDNCNSGTNFRARKSHNFIRGIRGRMVRGSVEPNLLHFGGCGDGESSYGDKQGGAFTTALVDSYRADETYLDWITGAQKEMKGSGQNPTWAETGYSFKSRQILK